MINAKKLYEYTMKSLTETELPKSERLTATIEDIKQTILYQASRGEFHIRIFLEYNSKYEIQHIINFFEKLGYKVYQDVHRAYYVSWKRPWYRRVLDRLKTKK